MQLNLSQRFGMRVVVALSLNLSLSLSLGACGESGVDANDVAAVQAADVGPGEPPPVARGPIEFVDRGAAVGFGPARVHGVSLVDFNGDGWPDLTLGDLSGLRLWVNRGDGRFVDRTAALGVEAMMLHSAFGVVYGDVDADGDLDLFVTRGDLQDRLLINQGDRFVDDTEAWGLVDGPDQHEGAVFGDLDGDGDLDLYVVSVRDPAKKGAPPGQEGSPNLYWRNEGDHFVDGTAEAGLAGKPTGETFAALVFDADGDGDQDVFCVHDFSRDEFFINDGAGHFGPMPDDWLHPEGSAMMGIDLGDLDGDGDLDIFGTDFGTDFLLAWVGPDGENRWENRMLVALGDGVDPGLGHTGWGAAVIDVDNDGDPDLLSTGAFSDGLGYQPEIGLRDGVMTLYENLGWGLAPGGFVAATDRAGAPMQAVVNGFGLAVGDIDRDGDLDALVGIDSTFFQSGPHHEKPGWQKVSMLLENVGTLAQANHSLMLRLRDPTSKNGFAVGARVDVHVGERRASRVVTAGASYLSSHSFVLHFGLGKAAAADSVRVTWPDGQVQEFGGLPAGRRLLTREAR